MNYDTDIAMAAAAAILFRGFRWQQRFVARGFFGCGLALFEAEKYYGGINLNSMNKLLKR